MKILITGGCGFVGANLALFLNKYFHVNTMDNLSRKGSKFNLDLLKKNKIKNFRIDIRYFKNFKILPQYDLIIDCCAEAAIEVSKKKIDHVFNTNLLGTFNILKKAKFDKSKLIFLSTSRVYSILEINKLFKKNDFKKKLKIKKLINEKFSILGPKSIYGSTKISSEMLIEEFSYAFKIKYLINRCGVISGPLQFGKQDQGFISLWIWRHLTNKKINYIGYDGYGNQVRDVLHIKDLCNLILKQILKFNKIFNKTFNVGGSLVSHTSLLELTKICQKITNNKTKIGKFRETSIYDIPYYITDNSFVSKTYKWKPKKDINIVVRDTFMWIKKNKIKLNKYF
ncbi:NAD-dependent epimerase/dehydratase family protein [Candidatus Pelagibacter sp.]|nr:NAD-dependent epimerase/dehydratase family protein [Candidatus Pelagibacter sp.]